jgi:peptidoglycan hydrolase CwlO-like protein
MCKFFFIPKCMDNIPTEITENQVEKKSVGQLRKEMRIRFKTQQDTLDYLQEQSKNLQKQIDDLKSYVDLITKFTRII